MRLHVLSDLHIEFAPFRPPETDADVVVVAGDVHPGARGLRWLAEAFPDKPVVYVLGNHEFYRESIPRLTDDLRALAAGTRVHLLENERVELDGIIFLGATLWTDFALDGNRHRAEALAADGISDFHVIRVTPTGRLFTPADARRRNAESLRWLQREFRQVQGRRCLVVTHHAPSPRSIGPWFRGDPLNHVFASDLDPLVAASGAAVWIHGQIHQACDYVLGRTRVVNNPRGYPDEFTTGFNPGLLLEV